MSDQEDEDFEQQGEDLQVRCVHCRDPWLVSKRAFDEATAILVREFPADSIVAMPVNIGYLCPKCRKAHEDDPFATFEAHTRKTRKPRRKQA